MEKKIVDYSRNYGEVKVRTGKQYVPTTDKSVNNFSVITPEKIGEFAEKFGKFDTTDIYSTDSVFADFSVELLPAEDAPAHDPHHDDMVYNQEHCELIKVSDGVYKLSYTDLREFESSVTAQGSHKWVAIAINTGEDTIVGMKWGNYTLTQADVNESASVNLPAGSIIYWHKADKGGVTQLITNENKSIALIIE